MRHRIVKQLEPTAQLLAEQVRADAIVSSESECDVRDRFLMALMCDTTEYPDPPAEATHPVRCETWKPQDQKDAAYGLLNEAIRLLRDQAEHTGDVECTRFVHLVEMIFLDHATEQFAVVSTTHRRYVALRRENANRHRAAVLARDGHSCRYCGSRCNLTLDHVQPLSQGGSDSPRNLVAACKSCNASKGARTPEQAGMVLR